MARKRGGKKKRGALVKWMELNLAVDAHGTASRRDRCGKEGGLVNIYITRCYFYLRLPPLLSNPDGQYLNVAEPKMK